MGGGWNACRQLHMLRSAISIYQPWHFGAGFVCTKQGGSPIPASYHGMYKYRLHTAQYDPEMEDRDQNNTGRSPDTRCPITMTPCKRQHEGLQTKIYKQSLSCSNVNFPFPIMTSYGPMLSTSHMAYALEILPKNRWRMVPYMAQPHRPNKRNQLSPPPTLNSMDVKMSTTCVQASATHAATSIEKGKIHMQGEKCYSPRVYVIWEFPPVGFWAAQLVN